MFMAHTPAVLTPFRRSGVLCQNLGINCGLNYRAIHLISLVLLLGGSGMSFIESVISNSYIFPYSSTD